MLTYLGRPMSNDSGIGRGSWSEDGSPRGSVRSLFGDESEGSGAPATEEWYETERLAPRITAGGRRPQSVRGHDGSTAVLDWRHAEIAPPPMAVQRLGRGLVERRRRAVTWLGSAARRHCEGPHGDAPDSRRVFRA
jgi:hypothetical protein